MSHFYKSRSAAVVPAAKYSAGAGRRYIAGTVCTSAARSAFEERRTQGSTPAVRSALAAITVAVTIT